MGGDVEFSHGNIEWKISKNLLKNNLPTKAVNLLKASSECVDLSLSKLWSFEDRVGTFLGEGGLILHLIFFQFLKLDFLFNKWYIFTYMQTSWHIVDSQLLKQWAVDNKCVPQEIKS